MRTPQRSAARATERGMSDSRPALVYSPGWSGNACSAVTSAPLPTEMTTGPGAFWITVFDQGTVVRVNDLDGKAIGKPIAVGHRPNGIDYDGETNSVWVANTRDETVSRIDPKTGRVLSRASAKGPLEGALSVNGGVARAAGSNDVVRLAPIGSS
jgi:DNA-binding beta-propeller fold protein YncE